MKQNSKHAGADTHLHMLYHDSSRMPVLEHSVGLQHGMAGIVNAYSGRRYTGSNAVVLAHEFLHTLGATDKYDFATGQPLFPDGYAEPTRKPLYPQKLAELMGGHIPTSPQETRMPRGLSQVVIGTKTAEEINWTGESE